MQTERRGSYDDKMSKAIKQSQKELAEIRSGDLEESRRKLRMKMFPDSKIRLARLAFAESVAEAKLRQSREICYSAAALQPLRRARDSNKKLVQINKNLQRKIDKLEHQLGSLESKLRHAKEEAMKMKKQLSDLVIPKVEYVDLTETKEEAMNMKKELPDLVKPKGEYLELNDISTLKKEETETD